MNGHNPAKFLGIAHVVGQPKTTCQFLLSGCLPSVILSIVIGIYSSSRDWLSPSNQRARTVTGCGHDDQWKTGWQTAAEQPLSQSPYPASIEANRETRHIPIQLLIYEVGMVTPTKNKMAEQIVTKKLPGIEHLSPPMQFAVLACGVFFFFGIHNLLQEAMMNVKGFTFGVMLGYMEVFGYVSEERRSIFYSVK